MKWAEIVAFGGVTRTQSPPRINLFPVDFKLDGPATYLSWLHRITGALARRGLDGDLIGEEKEPPVEMSSEAKAWKAIHMSLYTWLLNSMVPSIATTVGGIQNVNGIGEITETLCCERK